MIEEFSRLYPSVYHAADEAARPQIERYGLLSSKAISQLVSPGRSDESALVRRLKCERVGNFEIGSFVLRDQKPLNEKKLTSCLTDGLTVQQWLSILNEKVFFWATPARLGTFVAHYTNQIILQLNTHALLKQVQHRTSIAVINTGSVYRKPARRGRETFVPLAKWQRRENGKTRDAAELVVDNVVDVASAVDISCCRPTWHSSINSLHRSASGSSLWN